MLKLFLLASGAALWAFFVLALVIDCFNRARVRRRLEGPSTYAYAHWVRARLNGKLSEADREYLKMMFHRLKNKFLHVPISALKEETQRASGGGHLLLEAMRTLFRLE